MEPLATSEEQTAVCPQTLHGPPPTSSSSPPIKRPNIEKSVSLVNEQEKIASDLQGGHVRAQEMDNTNTQTHDNMKVQESQGQHQLPELSSFATQTTVSTFHTFKMAPRTPSCSFQTLQVTLTEPSTRIQTLQNPGLTTIPTEASEERGHQKGPKEVVVLKVTEPFIYEFKEGGKKMFHATVATESEFFRVKVFDFHLKEKFIPKTVIAISDYIGRNGFLEIYSASSVSHVSADRKMEISSRLIKNANATPKIEYLCSQCTVKYVNGVYTVYKI
nr:pyrin and HIN domain-containing protein 1-like isoform X3 [Marmota flaviventris]